MLKPTKGTMYATFNHFVRSVQWYFPYFPLWRIFLWENNGLWIGDSIEDLRKKQRKRWKKVPVWCQSSTCVELLRGDTKPHSIRSHHLLHPSASPCRHQHIIVWYKLVAKILNSFCVDCLNHHRDLWLWKPQEGLSFNLEAGLRNIMVETS